MKTAIVCLALLACAPALQGETAQERDARMSWWREARFGMFVHWGLYSGLAGNWEGKTVGDSGGMEWLQQRVGADTETYAKHALPLFRPKEGFAREWARLAKDAGCKYVVLTSKHHEGFALHDSELSDYDAGSVLHRDLIREFVDACREQGLRVGLYHSVIDWHHGEYDFSKSKQLPHPLNGKSEKAAGRDHSKYVEFLHGQVGELISNYGTLDILWWDYSSEDFQGQEAWRAFDLMQMVREKQPQIIMNNRLFRNREAGWANMGTAGYLPQIDPKYGDFITPEQHIPDTGMPGVDWETCMTMNTTWGYNEHDRAWKSDEVLVQNLIDIASKGGNYLLNIGPRADGSVPVESVRALQSMGKWMAAHGEAIHGTSASPFEKQPWGRCTTKNLPDGRSVLYLHVFAWPENRQLSIPALGNIPERAVLLGSDSPVDFHRSGEQIRLELPETAPNRIASVVALTVKTATR